MIESVTGRIAELWGQAVDIWLSGGWAMIAIAITALVMFALGSHVHLKLASRHFSRIREKTLRRWVADPSESHGEIGDLLKSVSQERTVRGTANLFEEMEKLEVAPFERDLRVMNVCVSAAPLLGLLGTVTGMLATFAALASGSGGDKTMGLVAEGISEALVTTETGLVIALAGLFFRYHLVRKLESYKAFLAHLEAICTQKVLRAMTPASPVPSVGTLTADEPDEAAVALAYMK